jgi:uncharacterized membrane protein YeaQ/YmgE (transglycosylase-associated protein family)
LQVKADEPHIKKVQRINGQAQKHDALDKKADEHVKKSLDKNKLRNPPSHKPVCRQAGIRRVLGGESHQYMNVFSWIIFGTIVGIVANAIDPTPNRNGVFGSIMLGIVGALVGGFLANLMLGITVTGFNVTSFLVAIAGSLLLLFIGKAMRRA